jgi:hypothetical protein
VFFAFVAAGNAATLTIDGSQTYQTIDGFGVNANHRSWTNNELKPVLDSLIAGREIHRCDPARGEALFDIGHIRRE